MAGSGTLRVSILGPLTATRDDAPVDLGGRRQRAVLALLLLARGDVVPAETLVESVWGEQPPSDPANAVQAYISHLRRRLEPGSAARTRSGVIVREGRGYAVRLPAEAVDAWRFENLLREAAAGDPRPASRLLRESLALWSGPALADYPDEPWAAASQALPEEGTTSFVFFRLPPLPEVPPPLAGKLTLGVRFLWTADPGEGARLLDEIRAVAPVILDDAALKPYAAVDSVHADPVDPMPVIDPAILMRDFPAEAAEQLLAVAGSGSGSALIMVEVRQLGGAYARSPEHSDAFSHRDARYSVLCVGIAPDPRSMPSAERVFAALADWDTGTVWPNFGPIHDGASARRAYDPETLARLADVVATYDPDGVLQHGRFIREAG